MKTTTRALALAGALSLAALACGESERGAEPASGASSTAPAPAGEPAAPAPAPAAAAAPAPAAKPAAGAAAQVADAARGQALYVQFCASCHGATGAGDGPLSAGLVPKPARHNDGHYMNALSDAHLLKVIQQGGPAVGKSPLMAPWGGALSEPQIRDVIAFLRSIAVPPYPKP